MSAAYPTTTVVACSASPAPPRKARARMAALLLVMVVLVGGAFPSSGNAADTFAIVDTLGSASTSSTFSLFGSGGTGVSASQLIGPRFTLTAPTVITEVGAFTNNCRAVVAGIPQCPGTRPFNIQIRPARGGGPDPSRVIATIVLSHDDDPLVVSYESAAPQIVLSEGTYFALIVPEGDDEGFLLGSASDPFDYRADLATFGFLDSTSGQAFSFDGFGAVRILGRAQTVAEQLADLGVAVDGVGPGTSLADKIADAQAALSAGESGEACEILAAFGHQVEAQSGKSISENVAGEFLATAARIRAVLAC